MDTESGMEIKYSMGLDFLSTFVTFSKSSNSQNTLLRRGESGVDCGP